MQKNSQSLGATAPCFEKSIASLTTFFEFFMLKFVNKLVAIMTRNSYLMPNWVKIGKYNFLKCHKYQ
jgi:hypothetical protein